MDRILPKYAPLAATILVCLFACLSLAQQTNVISGSVIGEDGKPLSGAVIKIDRTDIPWSAKLKTDKNGEYYRVVLLSAGAVFKVTLEVGGKDVDFKEGVRPKSGEPLVVDFDLAQLKKRQEAAKQAIEAGTLTADQARSLSAEDRAVIERLMKQQQEQLAKNKPLYDAFNQGMEAMQAQQYQAAVEAFIKASELDPKQHVVWGQLAGAYSQIAAKQTGAEKEASFNKSLEAYRKAIEIKPDDPAYHYSIGAVMMNMGQTEASGQAFQKAIAVDPKYAPAQYQYALYLVGKAQIGADGKIQPFPGTLEALQAYLALQPTGQDAEAARALLTQLGQTIQTEYKNPDAKKPAAKKK